LEEEEEENAGEVVDAVAEGAVDVDAETVRRLDGLQSPSLDVS